MKKTRKSFMGMMLSLVIVTAMFVAMGVTDVQAAQTGKYTPYYDAEEGVVKGCPEIGSLVAPGTIFSGAMLEENMSIHFTAYATKEEADLGVLSTHDSVDYGEEAVFEDYYNCDLSQGWIVYDCFYDEEIYYEGTEDEEVYKSIELIGYAKAPLPIVSPITVSVDWAALAGFQEGAPLPKITDKEVQILHEGLAVFDPDMDVPSGWGQGWLTIKVKEEHVSKGYIDRAEYEDGMNYCDGWLDAAVFSGDYRINLTDEYGWTRDSFACDTYRFTDAPVDWNADCDIAGNIVINADHVTVREAYTYCYMGPWDTAMIHLNLGTGEQIVESIIEANGGELPPVTPDPDPAPTPEEGWKEDATGYWYQNADGSYPYSTWKQIDGDWYYFDASGYRVNGWKQIGGTWYYFNLDYGWMYDGGSYEIDGNIYLFDASGAMVTGWYAKQYEYVGETCFDWYYFDASGYRVNGWKQIGGTWYYFDLDSGLMYQDIATTIDGEEYLFDASGALITGWYKVEHSEDNYDWFYLTPYGLKTGWFKEGNTWYYFDEEYAYMYYYTLATIDGQDYIFDKSGAMVTGWYKDAYEYDGETYVDWYYAKSDGTLAKGWFKEGNTWYYFEPEYSYMYSDGLYEIDGKVYLFKESGAMATGWQLIEGDWYYFGTDGAAYTGWVQSGASWYYIDEGFMYYDGIYFIEAESRYAEFDASGVWLGYVVA